MSMFGGDSEQLHALIDRLDDIPDDVLKKNWPRTLSELVEVTGAELQRQGIEPVLARQTGTQGGCGLRQPIWADGVITCRSGKSLFAELRNNEIFSRWDRGEKIESLRRHYRMSETQIYTVIREQRRLHLARTQPPLSDIPQSLPPFLHRYADSENIMRQRNNAKTPRTTA